MLAADGGDIVVALIACIGVLGGAAFGFAGVVYTVRGQRRTRIVERTDDEKASALMSERDRAARAEAERDVWKQIALESRNGPPGVDPPDPSLPN